MRVREVFGPFVLAVCARSAAGQAVLTIPESRSSVSPLAYVRTLTVAPASMSMPDDPPRPPMPDSSDKRRLKEWQQHARVLDQRDRLRGQAPSAVMGALTSRLGDIPGLTILQQEVSESASNSDPAKSATINSSSDAVIRISIDRFGVQAGVERRVWLRVKAILRRTGQSSASPPFYAFGRARTVKTLFQKAFQKTDQQLLAAAADGIAREIVHYLMTGEEPLFARSSKVAILPAAVPSADDKTIEGSSEPQTVPLPALVRQQDVLFQPELTPVTEQIDPDQVTTAMLLMDIQPRDLWKSGGKLDNELVKELGRSLDADYVFASRVVDIDLTEEPVTVTDADQPRHGVLKHATAQVEGALMRTSDGAVIWSDRREAVTAARTEYVRHQARIPTDEQCYVDATRVAYAFLRFSLEEYKRKFEK